MQSDQPIEFLAAWEEAMRGTLWDRHDPPDLGERRPARYACGST